ncbi:MAG: hypothetical protein ABSA10_05375 [Anaerolineales bacterium]
MTDALEGMGIRVITSELPEILCPADHPLVLHKRRWLATLPAANATHEEILLHAAGAAAPIEGEDRMAIQKKSAVGEQP